MREALARRRERTIAITPIVGGKAVKGPAAVMMKTMGIRPAAVEVAKLYRDFAGVFVLDAVDRKQAAEVEAAGVRAVVVDTIMLGKRGRKRLARAVCRELEIGI
jgi:LPPG:FO 2-phospho-L-lactate transferase